MLPGAGAVADLEVDNFLSISSFQMDAGTALKLTRRIGETLRRPDVAGVAVTHGTDTMEESAYLADILVDSEKPVVFTGAQRSADEPDGDGPRNLMGAIRAAASPVSAGLGAMICFNDELHAARDVTKTHTSAVQTFQSQRPRQAWTDRWRSRRHRPAAVATPALRGRAAGGACRPGEAGARSRCAD